MQHTLNTIPQQPVPDRSDVANDAPDDDQPLLLSPRRHDVDPDSDRFYAALLLFNLLGIGTLLPWNFFTTAKSYFDFKLRNVSAITGQPDEAWMRQTFESNLAVFSNVPGVLCVLVNAAAAGRISNSCRMVVALILMIVMFTCSTAFVLVDTDMHQREFFWATLASVAFMSGSGAVIQGSLFGLAAMLPKRYTNAVTLGQAAGGVIAAVAYTLSLVIGSRPKSAAFLYFLLATLLLLMCLAGYVLLRRLSFVAYNLRLARGESLTDSRPPVSHQEPQTQSLAATVDSVRQGRRRLSPSWRHLAGPGIGAFTVLAVTLTLYPTLLSTLAPISDEWLLYSPLSCFLAFNSFDLLGRLLTIALPMPGACRRSRVSLVVFALLRLLFVPLFLMCYSTAPGIGRTNRLPLLFVWDWAPPVLVSLFGLTNGYLFSLCFMRASEESPVGLAETHGAIMSMCAVMGSCTGSGLSFLFSVGAK